MESVPAGCLWVQIPAGQRQIPRGTGLRLGTAAGELGKPLLRASPASAADIPRLIVASGFQMEMLARRRGRGLAVGLSPGPPRPRDAGAEEALV